MIHELMRIAAAALLAAAPLAAFAQQPIEEVEIERSDDGTIEEVEVNREGQFFDREIYDRYDVGYDENYDNDWFYDFYDYNDSEVGDDAWSADYYETYDYDTGLFEWEEDGLF